MRAIKNITITPEILKLIGEIDEFKGRWTVIETLAPESPPMNVTTAKVYGRGLSKEITVEIRRDRKIR